MHMTQAGQQLAPATLSWPSLAVLSSEKVMLSVFLNSEKVMLSVSSQENWVGGGGGGRKDKKRQSSVLLHKPPVFLFLCCFPSYRENTHRDDC